MYSIGYYFAISLIIGLISAQESIECNEESVQKMDQLAMQLSTFGDPNGRYPTTQKEFADQCKKDRLTSHWMKDYIEKCLKGLSYDVSAIASKDIETVTNKYCDSPKLSKLLISWADCGNSAINQTVKCWNQYILDMERVNKERENIVNKDKMALICCIYHQFDHCIEESFIREGSVVCSPASVNGLHSILTEISGRMIENFCGVYQADNDKCDSLLNQYKYLNDIQISEPLNKSPINAFIQIIDSTPEFVNFMKDLDNKTIEKN